MSLIPALGRQRQVDCCEFKVSLVYKVSSWQSEIETLSQNKNKNKNKNAKTHSLLWTSPHKMLHLGHRKTSKWVQHIIRVLL